MAQQKEPIMILGGGPAGMACAMELHAAGRYSTIIEKESQIGGLARTLEFKEGEYLFRTDIGPHRFFSKNRYLYDFIENLLNEKWIVVRRKTRQYIDGKYYDYPVRVGQALRQMGLWKAFAIIFSYCSALIQYRVGKKRIENFEDYIVANFGKKLGEFNMLNYTEKIWGLSCKELHPDWAKQRIKGLHLRSALQEALFRGRTSTKPKTLVDEFYYPQFGTGLIYETIAERIRDGGSTIHTNSSPVTIVHRNNNITEIDLVVDGKRRRVQPSVVVSSIPITELIRMLSPAPPKEVIDAVAGLRWRGQVYLFITFDKEKITGDNWIYFPEKELAFGRISEMKNFSKSMSPKEKTSLFVEFFVTAGDAIWNMNPDEVFELFLKQASPLKLFSRDEVRKYYVFRKKYVYPVYDLEYPGRLETVKYYLNGIKNLHYIGRPGRFQYTNQDHSLEMGILAAKSILENRRYDFDTVGSEGEYFEKGYVRTSPLHSKTS